MTPKMTGDNVNQYESNEAYDLLKLLEANKDDDYIISPFSNMSSNCEYYEPSDFNRVTNGTKGTNMSCFHLNCRGLSKNWENFDHLIKTLHGTDFSFDFVGISECFRHTHDSRINLDGYHDLISRNRESDYRGGVGLFIKQSIQFKVCNDLSVFIPNVFESVFVEAHCGKNAKQIIGVIYRPNTAPKADIDIFTDTLNELLDIINKEKKYAIIMGDMNIDLLKFETNECVNRYIEVVFSNGFIPAITKPTRIGETSATLIDHMLCNNFKHQFKSGVIITDVADHFGIYHIIEHDKFTHNIGEVKTRKFCEKKMQQFDGNCFSYV